MRLRWHYLVILVALLGADATPTRGAITGGVVVVSNGKRVTREHVYVYLEEIPRPRRRARPGDGIKREIQQRDRKFVPKVLVVPVGAEVAFPNYDREVHNVFSPMDPPFDLGRYNLDRRGKSHVFEDRDEFDIFCDMHSWMSATVKVVDTAYIAQVKDGRFTFYGVAPGTYMRGQCSRS